MNIVIFDTETTSINKKFCYNIGYVIADGDTSEILLKREFVVEQVWHNDMLFSTAYFADKKPFYVKGMRGRKIKMAKYGYICQQMIRDFKQYEIEYAFAYNSPFDVEVFDFNCDWFKCSNPFDNIPIIDIRGYVHNSIIDDDFKNWCEVNEKFTDSGNYSTTAETVYQYIINDSDFVENHTALDDSCIEAKILFEAISKGSILGEEYQALRSIPRLSEKTFMVKKNGETIFSTECLSITYRKSNNTILLK